MDRVKRIWYLSPMRAAKVQASLRIRAVSPEPPLLAHKRSESRGTFRHKTRSLAPLNGWACAVKICHDGMLEDTNSLDGAHVLQPELQQIITQGLRQTLKTCYIVIVIYLISPKFTVEHYRVVIDTFCQFPSMLLFLSLFPPPPFFSPHFFFFFFFFCRG